jgi:hypothetical protein
LVVEGREAIASADGSTTIEDELAIDRDIDALIAAGETTSAIAKRLTEAGRGERRHLYARVAERRHRS